MIMTSYIKLHYKWVVLFSSFLNSLNFEPPCSFLHDKRQSHLLILICMMWTNEIKSHSAMIKVQWQTNVFAQWRNKYEIVIQMYWKIMYIPMTYSWTKLLSFHLPPKKHKCHTFWFNCTGGERKKLENFVNILPSTKSYQMPLKGKKERVNFI